MSHPYLFPNICGGFHAKFQDSRTNDKKPTQHSYAKSHLAIFTMVCGTLIHWYRPYRNPTCCHTAQCSRSQGEDSLAWVSPSLSVGHHQPRPHHLPHPLHLQLCQLAGVQSEVPGEGTSWLVLRMISSNITDLTRKGQTFSQDILRQKF